jgi:hypothetical protein
VKVAGILLLGAALGFLAGVMLSEVIAVLGVPAGNEALGWKPVPLVTAAVGAAVAGWPAASRTRREGRR